MADKAPGTAATDRACSICGVDGAVEPLIVNSGHRMCINGAACNARRQPATAAQHRHDDCQACRNEHYEQAKADPVASVVLNAMQEQDAVTYNGTSSDMGQVALDAAAKIREALSGA